MTWKQSIPVVAARSIAEQYGWDQVVIIARKIDPNGGEHVTTYGRDKAHCDVAARCGDFLKYKVMGWHQEQAASAQETKPTRMYSGVGHLEETGYIPAGSAEERERDALETWEDGPTRNPDVLHAPAVTTVPCNHDIFARGTTMVSKCRDGIVYRCEHCPFEAVT